MAVYLISEVTVRDPAAFERYRALAAPSILAHGGKYLVRGGERTLLEGGPEPSSLVILEFPDSAAVDRWYASAEYAPARAIRDDALSRRLIMVEGVAPV